MLLLPLSLSRNPAREGQKVAQAAILLKGATP